MYFNVYIYNATIPLTNFYSIKPNIMKKISTSVVIAIIIIAGILNSCDKKVKTPLTKEDGNTCNKICADFSNLVC